MDADLLFGVFFGFTIIPIALAAVLGEWLNERVRSRVGETARARNWAAQVRCRLPRGGRQWWDEHWLCACETVELKAMEPSDSDTAWVRLIT